MDIVDYFFWELPQNRAILEVAKAHDDARSSVRRLEEENYELRLRVAALTRLLINRGVFNAEDFAASVAEVKQIVAKAPSGPAKQKSARVPTSNPRSPSQRPSAPAAASPRLAG